MSEMVIDNKIKENKLGVMPIPKLLLTMSLPAIFSMLVLSLYNIVDSLFVAKVSGLALDAVSFAFPLQQIMLAFSLGVGVGTSTIVARRLGEKNKADADTLAQTGFKMAILTTIFFMILGSFLPKLFMQIFTANEQIVNMGTQYLTICMVCCFGSMIEILFSKVLQATGNMIIPMLSQLLGAVINIIFDPIFIFVCKLGIVGAGIATVLGQIISMIFVIVLASRRRHIIDMFFKNVKISFKKLKEIVRIGLPVMIMNAVSGIIVIIMNSIIIAYSTKAPSALGVYFKLQSFVFMPIFGLNQGALPIMSYNFGANQDKRYKQTFWLSIIVSLAIMAIGLVIFQLCPEWLIGLFENSTSEQEILEYAELLKVGTVTLKVISWSFLFAAVNIIVTTGYQSIGYGITSLLMSLLRQVIFILPLAILFGKLWGLDVLWWSYPLSDILVMLIFTPYYFFAVKKAFAKRKIAQAVPENQELENIADKAAIESNINDCLATEEALIVADTMGNESVEEGQSSNMSEECLDNIESCDAEKENSDNTIVWVE